MKKLFITLFVLLAFNATCLAEVLILHTSDVHGRISPVEYKGNPSMGGFSRRVTLVNELRSQNKNVLLLDSGDVFQGSLYYRIDTGKSGAKLLSDIKYDAITLGNHEFDNGLKILKRNVKLSKTTFLSANVHFKDKYLKNAIKPYITKDFDGEKYLIIGVTTSSLSNLSNTTDIKVTNPITEIQDIIEKVPHDRVVILSHCGLDQDRQIADAIPSIDLILGGHNHYSFNAPEYENQTPIVQDGEFGTRVGLIQFDKNLRSYTFKNIDSEMNSNEIEDEKIAKVNKKIKKVSNKVIAHTSTELIGDQYTIEHSQTNLGKLVLLSMAHAFPEYDGVITNSGSIRINRNFSGNITYADLLEILPFDNVIVKVKIQGKYLKEVLKHGEATNRRYLQYYLKDPVIEDDKEYTIITNQYIASGKDGYESFKYGEIVEKSRKSPVKLLQETLQELGEINASNIKF